MFDLHNATAHIRSVNLRTEKHGPEEVPCADLKIETKQPNSMLSEFGPQLRDALYWRAPTADGDQGSLDGVDEISDKPNLRCPEIETTFALKYEGAGYHITIDHGINGKSAIEIEGVDVNGLKFEAHEGGTITLVLRAQFEIDDKLAGKLAMLIGREVTITVTPPAESKRLAA